MLKMSENAVAVHTITIIQLSGTMHLALNFVLLLYSVPRLTLYLGLSGFLFWFVIFMLSDRLEITFPKLPVLCQMGWKMSVNVLC